MTNPAETNTPLPGLGAVLLAGGQSRRMGRPKALLPFGDELLLQRVARRLGEVCSPIVVVRAPGQTLPDLPKGTRIAEDAVTGRGPLQGLAAGLSRLSGDAQAAFVSSTDAPFVDPRVIRLLASLRGDAYDIAVPRAEGHFHPLAAVYGLSVLPEIAHLLSEDRLRPFFLFERVRTLIVEEPTLRAVDPSLISLKNLNTPDDYREALAIAGLA